MTWTTWIIIFAVLQVIHFLGTQKLYQRAGRKAWEAIVPVYSIAIWLKILNRPMWWCFIPFLPIVGPIMIGVLWYDTARSFGKGNKEGILAVVTLGFYLFYLSYVDKDAKYQPLTERKETMVSAVLYAVIVATMVHIFMIQPMVIPTGSMEKTLLVGDGLLVNKWSYGYRVPQTPIALPFLQNTVPFTSKTEQSSNGAITTQKPGVRSYVDAVRLPYTRIGQFKTVQPNDIVVFNYPADSVHTAFDRKDPYVKRCIAVAGDMLEIKNGVVYVNGKQRQYPADAKLAQSYMVKAKTPLNLEYLTQSGIQIDDVNNVRELNDNMYYFVSLTTEEVAKLKSLDAVESVAPFRMVKDNPLGFDARTSFPTKKDWTVDDYGPLQIPKAGQTVTLTPENIDTYRAIITQYEHNTLEESNGKIVINGKPTNQYTIQQDYYWMMGDNRHNSLDSRFFGFVPEDHILGSPVLTWMSFNLDGDKKPRWSRFFTIPNNGDPDKPSYLWVLGVIIAGAVGYSYLGKKKEKK